MHCRQQCMSDGKLALDRLVEKDRGCFASSRADHLSICVLRDEDVEHRNIDRMVLKLGCRTHANRDDQPRFRRLFCFVLVEIQGPYFNCRFRRKGCVGQFAEMPQDGLMYSVTGIENNQYSIG